MFEPLKSARRLAWFLVGLYVLLIGAGLYLEVVTGTTFGGVPQAVIFLEVIVNSIWAAVGLLLVSRRPEHPVGWIFLAVPLLVAMDHFTQGYAYYGTIAHPGSLPGAKAAIFWQYWNGRSLGTIPVTFLFLLFPTGRPSSRYWLWVGRAVVVTALVYIPLAALDPAPVGGAPFPFPTDLLGLSPSARSLLAPARAFFYAAANVIVVISLASIILRLRRSSGVERLQLKWFVYTASLFGPGAFLILISGTTIFAGIENAFILGVILILIAVTGMAVASAVAILRYRLFDIDIIIHRTLVYGLLTAALSLLYFAAVAVFQGVFQGLTGEGSPIAIVVSTLLIAALFSPLRRRIQAFIDRRFFRRKYDAAKTLARFAASARDEVDLDSLVAELLRVVQETMEPDGLSLWLKESH